MMISLRYFDPLWSFKCKTRQAHEDELPKENLKPLVVESIPPRQEGLELPDELLRSETFAAEFPGVDGQPV